MQYYSQFTRSQVTWTIILAFNSVVFHISLRRLPLQKRVTLRKIGGHVVSADSQSCSFHMVIPQSILRITHYAIPQSINSQLQHKYSSRSLFRHWCWTDRDRLPINWAVIVDDFEASAWMKGLLLLRQYHHPVSLSYLLTRYSPGAAAPSHSPSTVYDSIQFRSDVVQP